MTALATQPFVAMVSNLMSICSFHRSPAKARASSLLTWSASCADAPAPMLAA